MNKIKTTLHVLYAIALTANIAICVASTYYIIKDHTDYSSTFEYHGHRYVLFHVNGVDAVTHDPDCPCHQKGVSDNE